MAVATTYEHITLDSAGIPVITGTTTKVVEMVMEVKAYGWSPEEIHFQHPYLSLGQIHSALAYYWDNRESIEMDISRRAAKVEKIQRETSSHSIRKKFNNKGLF
ncbi:MAG TPA: DUF433 domain-containing protein [Pyrinomonadaceae bacterium]|nr:DUF433 domain-containing protein [Pyrinomonadaceae bacterium]